MSVNMLDVRGSLFAKQKTPLKDGNCSFCGTGSGIVLMG